MDSLWGDEFKVEEKVKTKKIINKINKENKISDKPVEHQVKSKKLSLETKLQLIKDNVYTVLGKQVDNVQVITSKSDLIDYFKASIKFGRIAIDTETNNSLDPTTCKLMGLCLYVKGCKQVYVPVNHVDVKTGEKLSEQLSELDIQEAFNYFIENQGNCITVFHNGKFDYQVIKSTCNVEVPITWDTMIGSKLLDENEKAGLKEQYVAKIDPDQEKYSIDQLFENIEYKYVDPQVFALYAATDALMTDRLYEWQMERFNLPENKRILDLANNLEMRLPIPLGEMESAGMEEDEEYSERLSYKYNKQLDEVDAQIAEELLKLKPTIDSWRLTPEANERPVKVSGNSDTAKLAKSKNEQLSEEINMGSPTQVAILLYDILKCPVVNKKAPRGTGEDELTTIYDKLKLPICGLLLKRRELVKLIKTYITTIPAIAKKWPDHRVRTHFNQYGADTGRLSSGGKIVFGLDDEWGGVNFQNIPSHNKEIRMLFCAKPGYRIIGSDFSAQEPRLTAFYSQDENMIKAYKEGRDLYSVIASMSFDRKYEDCLEFYPEGTEIEFEGKKIVCGHKTHQNKEGKKYRTYAKSILLGVIYGRGATSVGEQIGKSREEAQEIIDKFFKAFPKVKSWIDKSISDAHKYGYVEDVAGRRRHLPDILLPKYEIIDLSETKNSNFNPFLCCEDRKLENKLIDIYRNKLENIRSRKDYEKIQLEAKQNNIEIHDNTGFIAQAERQAVNSRVQGGAATLTKQAILDIYNDKELRDMGAYLINTVHDEILIEAPEQYKDEAANRLVEIMINSAKKYVTNVPMSCDPYIVNAWYLDEFSVTVHEEFKKLLEKEPDPMKAFESMCSYRLESTRDQIYELVKDLLPGVPENVDPSYCSLD